MTPQGGSEPTAADPCIQTDDLQVLASGVAERAASYSLTELEQKVLDLYASGAVDLPAVPKVAAKLVPLLNSPNADVQECVKLIEVDAVLSTAMLRSANSVAFFRAVKIATVREAILRVGLKGAAQLAMSISTAALYDEKVQAALYFIESDYESQWRRAVLVAHAGRDIAEFLRVGEPNLAFTGGLFISVGASLAVFLLARLAVDDSALTRLTLDERLTMVHRLSGSLIQRYVERTSLPQELGQLCLQVTAGEEDLVETALILRVTRGLTADPQLPPNLRENLFVQALEAARQLGLTRGTLDAVKRVVRNAHQTVEAFVEELART